MSNQYYRSGWSYVGEGIMWLLIWIGFGGCVALSTGKLTVKGEDIKVTDNVVVNIKESK